MPGKDPARGARDTGRTGGKIGGRETSGAKDRDGGTRAPAGTGNAGYASGGSVGGGFAGNESKSFGRQISDLFGGPRAYANNPNAPGGKWNTRDFMVASYPDANWQAVVSSLLEAPTSAVGFASKMMSAAMDPIGPGMGMMGRMIGADYGQRGPDQPGGGLGRANQGGGGAIRPGYDLPPGYMQPQPPVPTVNPQPTLPSYANLNMPGKYLGIAPGYGAGVPGYMYPGPMKR